MAGGAAALIAAGVISEEGGAGGSENGGSEGSGRPTFLPETRAGPLLGQLVDAGFTCASADVSAPASAPAIAVRALGECTYVRPDGKARYVVVIGGPERSRVVTISTSIAINEGDAGPLARSWLRAGSDFRFKGVDPEKTRRWALAAFRRSEWKLGRGEETVNGPVTLRLFIDQIGRPTLEIRARGAPSSPRPPAELSGLAARFSPVLRFPDGEAFRPISVEQFIAEASLSRFYVRSRFSGSASVEVVSEHADVNSLPEVNLSNCGRFPFCYFALDLRAGEARDGSAPYVTLQSKLGEAPATVYWNAVKDRSGDLAIQYWFLYFYNGHKINRHEGDWEQLTVRLDSNLVPIEAGYSSHHSGEKKEWVDLVESLDREGDRPVVYVALGSHANYFSPGRDLGIHCFLRLCKKGIDTIPSRLDELAPEDYRLVKLTSASFLAGNFGSGNFLWNGRFGWDLHKLVVPDPRLRGLFKDPLVFLEKARRAF